MTTSTQPSGLADQIRRRLGDCTPAERKVGRVLLSAYPSAGFETVAVLAARAGVSGPTVVRFVSRLGFSGFPAFQAALRADLDDRSASPLSLYRSRDVADATGADEALARYAPAAEEAVRRTFADLPPSDFSRAVDLLARDARRVLVVGGRFSRLVGLYLVQHLQQMRPDVEYVTDRPEGRTHALADLGHRDVLVVFDYRRYEKDSARLAQFAVDRKASVVLFTDVWLSPVASLADAVLPSDTGTASAYDAMAPAMALVEAVVSAVLAELGDVAHRRMERIESVGAALDVF
ncbi:MULTISPECIES: MurR/RpiR family transcriptional regulator [Isoptericola]|uniref:MurR/RpiR family transcriptional regulator n=1 Tax=Isoptericola TaxID=254250 RepID=UPI0014882FDE|nr:MULTISPECIES: MurR/RpiR family transcriptional regulator [unclassified Isoptericola]MDO8144206.1 MurR/RpiR family transcriptional regulator [Isoptericola sp. 178]MDO8148060.1 MurR/RpiR family transcriptional regulator [Isoptericola sp. b515]MDO8151535.1 MurR/RpiR family transcriptional regulator [Isoptericola sp. b408]